jgi:DNA-binding GntR family transcriptional regulator
MDRTDKAQLPSAMADSPNGSARLSHGAGATLRRLLTMDEDHDSLVVTIAYELGLDIIAGRLKPGADLNSVHIAKRFQTSRTPAREALAMLEKQGLVEIPPRRRARVQSLSLERIRHIYEVRAALHALVAELVAKTASDAEIAMLREKLQAMQAAVESGDVYGYFDANMAFHEAATEICGNPMLKRMMDSFALTTLRLRYRTLTQMDRIKRSVEDHSVLVRAFESRDPTLASAIVRANILSALKLLEASQQGQY